MMIGRLAYLALLVSVGAGCGSSAPNVHGSWVYYASSSSAAYVKLSDDGTFLIEGIALTNVVTDANGNAVSASADIQEDTGVFTYDASSVSFSPLESSCASSPAFSAGYAFRGDDLELTVSGGIIVYTPAPAPDQTVSLAATLGCFDSSGGFTPAQLSPVN